MSKNFYKNAVRLDTLKKLNSPKQSDYGQLIQIVKNNPSGTRYFYEENEFGDVPTGGWLSLLYEAGEFDELEGIKEVTKNSQWLKANYLERVAGEKPDLVFSIVNKLKPEDARIQGIFIDAIGNLPVSLMKKGIPIIKSYLEGKKLHIWYYTGESAAKVMKNMAGQDIDDAFEIADSLLQVWVSEDSNEYSFRNMSAKFDTYEYNDLVFKYYKELWEKEPLKGVKLLVDIFNNYLNEVNSLKGYDSTEFLFADSCVDNIQQEFESEYETIIIKAIIQGGKEVSEKRPKELDNFLADLRKLDKHIFTRIEMYLLSLSDDPKYNDRINKIICNDIYFENPCFSHEYNLLLNKKFNVITSGTKKKYMEMVRNIKVDDLDNFADWFKRTRGREYTDNDLEKYVNSMRARKLYAVKEVFDEEYTFFKEQSGYSDEDLNPVLSMGEGWVDGGEGSPKTRQELIGMEVNEVLDYVSDPNNYETTKDGQYSHHSVEEALAYNFREAVKERGIEYIKGDKEKIENLPRLFLMGYFYGIGDTQKKDGFPWDDFLSICKSVVDRYGKDEEYGKVFEPMLRSVQTRFKKDNKAEYREDELDRIYEIIDPLFDLKEKKDESFEIDPVQLRCNSFMGVAMELSLSLGIVCKRDFESKYQERFREKIRGILNKILKKVKTRWTVCTFGSDLVRIYWMDKEWVEENIEEILSDEYWKIVWNTYLRWGRPSRDLFEFLTREGFYSKAIGLIGTNEKKEKDSRLDLDNNLANHIVMAYFNGWLGDDINQIMENFLGKASDELRGYAARFFTSGFKDIKKEPDAEVNDRLKNYWESRLEKICEKPDEHLKEAMAFAAWMIDSPFDKKVTFENVAKTLDVTRGKVDRDRDLYNFINSACDISDGYELEAIRCISKVIGSDNSGLHFSFYEEKLTVLFEKICNSKEADQELIRETAELIDRLGELHIYKLRKLYDKLSKRLK